MSHKVNVYREREICEFCGDLDATLIVLMFGDETISATCEDCGAEHFHAASPARDEIEVPF